MPHPEPTEELVNRPQGSSCLILGLLGIAAVFVLIVIVAMAGSVLFSARSLGPDPAEHPAVGRRLPRLDLVPLTGTDEPVTLDDLAGKVVLVNFWGTWCEGCRLEAPHLAQLYGKLGDRPDFKLLAVSCGSEIPEDPDRLRAETGDFLKALGLDMPTYADPDAASRRAFVSLTGGLAFPTTFVMDRQGVIRGVWEGFHPGAPKQMEQSVLRLLEDPSRGRGARS